MNKPITVTHKVELCFTEEEFTRLWDLYQEFQNDSSCDRGMLVAIADCFFETIEEQLKEANKRLEKLP